ncbi:MAG: NYN domain-containing protein, partial [Acidimicrobiia bacterium]
MPTTHLVVDGSNIATEGRSLPSLGQLLDAVDAIAKEHPKATVTVIVDATFGHRIDASERDAYEAKINAGEIITPPAGVIGRGDAFILEVADRADAIVLSNDSFQEFHGTYEWLFQEGRLLGGKHVPGVGWIFLPRSPVRGPTSRKAVSDAKRKRRGAKKAASKPGAERPAKSSPAKAKGSSKRGARKKVEDEPKDEPAGRKRGGKEPEPYNEPLPFIEFVGAHPVGSVIEAEVEQFASHGAYVVCDGTRCYISLKSISDPPPRSAREVLTLGETRQFVVQAIDTPR